MLSLFRLLVRWSLTLVLVAAAFSLVAGAANAALLAVVNEAISGGTKRLGLYAALGAAALVTRLGSQSLLLHLSQKRIFGLRLDLSRAVLRAPLRRIEEIGPSKIHTALVHDVLRVNLALDAFPRAITNIAVTVACLAYLAYVSLATLLPVIAVVTAALVIHFGIVRASRPYMRGYRAAEAAVFGLIRSMTDGLKELKLNRRRRTAFVEEGLNPQGIAYAWNSGRVDQLGLVSAALGTGFTTAGIGVLVFVWERADAKVVSAYVLTLLFMQPAIEQLVSMLPVFDQAGIVLQGLEGIGLSINAEAESHEDEQAPPPWKKLAMTDIEYTYVVEDEGHNFTVGPLAVAFEPGEIVFVVGGNGSGKSSFVKLLVGLYAPDKGTIALDGKSVDTVASGFYREMFAVVFADFHLFENLYGFSIAERRAEIDRYLKELELSKKVKVEDGRFSTIKLSSGQRKRLALLLAYLEDRPIYVFDEWASDQDPVYKQTFYREILPELRRRGKCVVVVSHDDRYFDVADRIITLEDGKIRSEARRAAAS